MSAPAPQRHYRAPCPSCGAPVAFESAQSTHAICAYCRSTMVREGDALKRIGQMAELFDDHSPLQLGTTGHIGGQDFHLVGRLQYQYAEGVWTEWHALLADGSSAWLSEDNGAYVFSRPFALPPGTALPAAAQLQVGQSLRLGGRDWAVSSHVAATLHSAQGELPRLPPPGQVFTVVELRSQDSGGHGEGAATPRVLSIDYGDTPPALFEGQPVDLAALALRGLKDESAAPQAQGRAFSCPHCGSSVAPKLAQSQSITCPQCASVIDLSQGVGGELAHAEQNHKRLRPLIALGTTGQLKGQPWQVVGYQARTGRAPGDDESFNWTEYLLYNAQQGFCFLVSSDEGWSLVRPLTDAPTVEKKRRSAVYQGIRYALQWAYTAHTTAVLGEFYWQVQLGQTTQNRDYANGHKLLSSEQSAHEITWSAGEKIDASQVAQAFGLPASRLEATDANPFTPARSISVVTLIIVVFIAMMLLAMCSSDDCPPDQPNCQNSSYSRTTGGSWGGYSSGGGHK